MRREQTTQPLATAVGEIVIPCTVDIAEKRLALVLKLQKTVSAEESEDIAIEKPHCAALNETVGVGQENAEKMRREETTIGTV